MTGRPTLGPSDRIALAARIWRSSADVWAGLRRHPLPELVARLGTPARHRGDGLQPRRLSRIVDRVLHVGPLRPRCLVRALVLYRLLRERGMPAQVVIGLPDTPTTKEAHAWVELDGRDVGPAPGRGEHVEVARYG